jgi:hypothetical protein
MPHARPFLERMLVVIEAYTVYTFCSDIDKECQLADSFELLMPIIASSRRRQRRGRAQLPLPYQVR